MNLLFVVLKGIVVKYFTTKAIERIIIVLLKALVQRTESKVDDELYEAVFGKIGVVNDGTNN